jgi:alkanesulfonate monooxygenase
MKDSEISPKSTKQEIDFFLSGSLPANLGEKQNSSFFIKNMRPNTLMEKASRPQSGLGLGICTRSTREEAISEAHRLFPKDRKGEFLFSLALSNNETPWNQWLSPYLENNREDDPDFYLTPIKNFWSAAPYLVGSYDHVAKRLQEFAAMGYEFFLLDFSPEDFDHVSKVMDLFKNS